MTAAPHTRRGFTLVEMLAVMGVILLLLAAVLPAITSVGKGRSLTLAAGNISTLLEQARVYAMANNTYVYVGFYEADATQSEGVRPQVSGIGRVYVGVVATKDGTTGYSTANWPATAAAAAANLFDINKPQRYDEVHLLGKPAVTAKLTTMDTSASDLDFSAAAGITFNSPVQATTNAICTYTQVVQFTPQGRSNIITDASGTHTQVPYIQFGLESTHGNQVNTGDPDCAGIQIDGITGVVSVYRTGQNQ